MHVFLETIVSIGLILGYGYYAWCIDRRSKNQPKRYCRRCNSYHVMTLTPNCRR